MHLSVGSAFHTPLKGVYRATLGCAGIRLCKLCGVAIEGLYVSCSQLKHKSAAVMDCWLDRGISTLSDQIIAVSQTARTHITFLWLFIHVHSDFIQHYSHQSNALFSSNSGKCKNMTLIKQTKQFLGKMVLSSSRFILNNNDVIFLLEFCILPLHYHHRHFHYTSGHYVSKGFDMFVFTLRYAPKEEKLLL